MYSIDLNNVVPHKDLTCLVAKASADESMLWHRRLGIPTVSEEFPLPEEVPTASEESSPSPAKEKRCYCQEDCTAIKDRGMTIIVELLYMTLCPIKGVLRIQQYLQHEHYALWEVMEFGDSYEAPDDVVATGSATEGTGKKKGRTVALTTEDMQKRKNDVKARTTLLLALPDEHQL
nr:hypothetical protein [Tanacetum cinerariifolium]